MGIRERGGIRLSARHRGVPTLQPHWTQRFWVLRGETGGCREGEVPGHSPAGSPAGCSPGTRREGLEPRLLGHSGAAGDPPTLL